MTLPGIWTQNDEGWQLSRPEEFPDEATLHRLIEETPEMLPLSGAPALLILGREVPLGSGSADLVGVEASGRPVVIEVKLGRSSEARRAVVAQILAYAANLHGTTREQLEGRFGSSLRQRGHESLVDAVASVQEGAFEADEFTDALDEHLSEGRFRLVFVFDSVPTELMTLVAYLEHVTDKLVVDLIAVNLFDAGGMSIVLPQRVTPERHEVTVDKTRREDAHHEGSERFEASIGEAAPEHREDLKRLLQWARELEQRGLARLSTTEGMAGGRYVLRLQLRDDKAGLVALYNEGGARVQFSRSVFERRAPDFIDRIESLSGMRLGQGKWTQSFSEELLEALADAYAEAVE